MAAVHEPIGGGVMLTLRTIGASKVAIRLASCTWRDDVRLQALVYGCGLLAAVLIAAYIVGSPRAIAGSEPTAQPEWIKVERPQPAFALIIPEAGDVPAMYSIFRHVTGGGRKDVLSLGEPHGTAPYLWIEIYRAGRETDGFGDVASEIAARVGDLGAVDAVRREQNLDSKFGLVSIVNLVTMRDIPRKCVGFVRAYSEPRLQISGMFCRGGSDFIEPSMLSCALDRIMLLAAGNDSKVAALFAQAELKRNFCGQRNILMVPTPKYPVLWKAVAARQAAFGARASAKLENSKRRLSVGARTNVALKAAD